MLISCLNPYLLKCFTAFGNFLEFTFLVCSRCLQKPAPLPTQDWIIALWIYLSFIRNGSCLLCLGNKSIPWQNDYLHLSSHSSFIYETVTWVNEVEGDGLKTNIQCFAHWVLQGWVLILFSDQQHSVVLKLHEFCAVISGFEDLFMDLLLATAIHSVPAVSYMRSLIVGCLTV